MESDMITSDVRTMYYARSNVQTRIKTAVLSDRFSTTMATAGVDRGLVALATITFLTTHCLVSPTVHWSRYVVLIWLRVYHPNSVTCPAPRARDIWAVIGCVTPPTILPSILDD